MKTLRLILICFLMLQYSHSLQAQARLVILKNGVEIDMNDMSLVKSDIITVKIQNDNPSVTYAFGNVSLEVRTLQSQQIKTDEEAARNHKKFKFKSGKFEVSPKITIDVKKYLRKQTTRMIVRVIAVEEIKNGKKKDVDWITYGKEYTFWFN